MTGHLVKSCRNDLMLSVDFQLPLRRVDQLPQFGTHSGFLQGRSALHLQVVSISSSKQLP